MSCYCRALPRLIPETILLAGRGTEIAIVSPWVANVHILPPRFGTGSARYFSTTISLNEFLLRIMRDFDMHIILLVRERDTRFQSAIRNLPTVFPNNLLIQEFPYLHAKMIVTNTLAIETSANLLQTSLFRNIESCTLVRNSFRDSRKYLRDKLGVMI
jgi:hypothetical protein